MDKRRLQTECSRAQIMHSIRGRTAWLVCVAALQLLPGFCPATTAKAQAARAESLSPSKRKAQFARFSVEQGLSQSTVQAIVQDHEGFLWFGTEEGLNRYDGYGFVVFKHDPKLKGSIPDDVVSALFEDRERRLWVGTEHGLSIFDRQTETFAMIPQIADRVTSIVEGSDGTLWVASEGGGLYLRNPATGTFASYTPDPKQASKSLSSFRVTSLLLDHQGKLWLGTRDTGVEEFVEGTPLGSFVHHRHDGKDAGSLSHDEVWGLAEDKKGNIWVATYGGGLNVWERAKKKFRRYLHKANDPNGLPTNLITCIRADNEGTLWIGTDGAGLLEYDADKDSFVRFTQETSDLSSLSANVVRSIGLDNQGQIWVGTFLGGVNLRKKPREEFGYYTYSAANAKGLSDASVASLLEDGEGRLWAGTEQGWLNRYDGKTDSFTRYRFPATQKGEGAILSLHADHSGRIWAGSYRAGLGRFDAARGRFTIYRHSGTTPKKLDADEIWSIAEAKDGTLWLGTNAGLDRFDPERGTFDESLETSLTGERSYTEVRSLLFDREDNLWVGCLGGLYILRHGSQHVELFAQGQNQTGAQSGVVSLLEDTKGRIWAGTLGAGLQLIDERRGGWTTYADFPSGAIFGIEEEADGRLWLSTNHGLARFDPETRNVETFDLSNGLQSLQFHMGASRKTREGRILFGSTNGFYEFDPERIRPNPFAPRVVVTRLRVFNEEKSRSGEISALKEIRLRHEDKIVSLEFAALDYTFPRRNLYAYRMEGLSEKWIDLGTGREVTFTNLDPGTYVFQVRASNSDGVWKEGSSTELKIVILPPWWKTLWFQVVMAVFAALLLLAMHRIGIRRLERDLAQRNEAQEAIRESEQRLRAIFDGAQFSIALCSTDTKELITNRAAREMLNCTEKEIQRLATFDELTHPDDRGRDAKMFQELMEGKRDHYEQEKRYILRDGRLVLANAYFKLLRDSKGKPRYVLALVEDITEKKELAAQLQQAQKMEAVGRLAGGIAHDFNNLLTVILGSCDLLREGLEPGTALQGRVNAIQRAGEGASSLTRQLLAFSRRQVVQAKIININEILSDMGKLFRPLLREDIELVVKTEEQLWPVRADAGQLEQVILNLVINARDAMSAGGKLRIETANAVLSENEVRHHGGLHPGPYAMLSVSDTGTGIDEEARRHIFEPFYTTKEKGKGTGLGLATVYGIVTQSGGHVQVESEAGRGAMFRVYLPRCEDAEQRNKAEAASRAARGTEKILVVEDQQELRSLVAEILQQEGYTVLLAGDGEEALQISDREPGRIELMVTDVVMPRMGARDLSKAIAAKRPDLRVLYMSGYVDDELWREDAARFAFLQKPFTAPELTRKVREMLDQSAEPNATNANSRKLPRGGT